MFRLNVLNSYICQIYVKVNDNPKLATAASQSSEWPLLKPHSNLIKLFTDNLTDAEKKAQKKAKKAAKKNQEEPKKRMSSTSALITYNFLHDYFQWMQALPAVTKTRA